MRHQFIFVDAIRAWRNNEPRRVLVIGLVTQVFNLGQFLGPHLRGDLLEYLATRYLVRQRRDDDVTLLDFVRCT